jgi:hypothetical protein
MQGLFSLGARWGDTAEQTSDDTAPLSVDLQPAVLFGRSSRLRRSSMAARVVALTLVVLVLAACGGTDAHTSQSDAAKIGGGAMERGPAAVGASITGVIDGISLLFSRPADVCGIQAGDRRVGARLARYERTLAAYSARVDRLGTPGLARAAKARSAARAFISLERAAVLIRKGIAAFQHDLGPQLLNGMGAAGRGRRRHPSGPARPRPGLGPNRPFGQ